MIHFTQFMLPNGRRVPKTFEASREVEAFADALVAGGYRFECEVLRTGDVHLDCCGPALSGTGDEAIAMEVCANGPPVVAAVERVVRDAHAAWTGSRS